MNATAYEMDPPARSVPAGLVWAAALLILLDALLIGLSSRAWIGATVPGFLLLPNRVVASIGLPTAGGSAETATFQHLVVAVDGHIVATTADVYQYVQSRPPGTPITYTLQQGITLTEEVTLPSVTLTAIDYGAVFGGFLLTGLLFALLGVVGRATMPDPDIARSLLLLGGVAGAYGLSAVGLYGDGACFRIHAFAEALMGAACVDLGLAVYAHARRTARTARPVAWTAAIALGTLNVMLLDVSSAYSLLHAVSEAYMGGAGVVLTALLTLETLRATPEHTRFSRPALWGAIVSFAMPTAVMLGSAVSGGKLPINLVTLTSCCFPLALSCGIRRARALRLDAALAPAPSPA